MLKCSQGQSSRSNVTKVQSLPGFATTHMPTNLHQFLTSNFRDFARTDKHQRNNTCFANIAGAEVIMSRPTFTAYVKLQFATFTSACFRCCHFAPFPRPPGVYLLYALPWLSVVIICTSTSVADAKLRGTYETRQI